MKATEYEMTQALDAAAKSIVGEDTWPLLSKAQQLEMKSNLLTPVVAAVDAVLPLHEERIRNAAGLKKFGPQ